MTTTTLPRPGVWVLDGERATVAFAGRVSRLSPTVSARFTGVSGWIRADDDPARAALEVDVDLRTMSTGNRGYDEVLERLDPFSADVFPCATYRSTRLRWSGRSARVEGELSLCGVTRPVALDVRHGLARDGARLVVDATGEVDRCAFGVRCELPGAALLVPRRMTLSIHAEAACPELPSQRGEAR